MNFYGAADNSNLRPPTPTGSCPPAQGCRNPGATDATISNPNGVVSSLPESARAATPLGLGLLLLNPGLQQPWAGGHDPVGVGNAKLALMGRCPRLGWFRGVGPRFFWPRFQSRPSKPAAKEKDWHSGGGLHACEQQNPRANFSVVEGNPEICRSERPFILLPSRFIPRQPLTPRHCSMLRPYPVRHGERRFPCSPSDLCSAEKP